MITITDEQLELREKWDLMLKRGECTLADCIGMCMGLGVPASEYLRARFESAITSYSIGECSDLAEPFGIEMGKREKNAMERETWISHVRFNVDSFHEQGFTKQDPSHYNDTAFHKAAHLLHRSASQIFDTYYGR